MMPFIHKHVAVMPDARWGKGSTVGSVIPTERAIIPAVVGADTRGAPAQGGGKAPSSTSLADKDRAAPFVAL